MFNWFKNIKATDGRTRLAIAEDQKRMDARMNYVRHEEARAYGMVSSELRMNSNQSFYLFF